MIVSMLTFEFVAMIFLCGTYNTTPVWLKIIITTIYFIAHLVAYASEDILREKVKSLEYEIKRLNKDGK